MRRGLFRTTDSFLGECARVHEDAGDAYPYLRPDLYRLLGFQPPYEELPLIVSQVQEREVANISFSNRADWGPAPKLT